MPSGKIQKSANPSPLATESATLSQKLELNNYTPKTKRDEKEIAPLKNVRSPKGGGGGPQKDELESVLNAKRSVTQSDKTGDNENETRPKRGRQRQQPAQR